jgi:hypothetical protein
MRHHMSTAQALLPKLTTPSRQPLCMRSTAVVCMYITLPTTLAVHTAQTSRLATVYSLRLAFTACNSTCSQLHTY